MGWDIFNEKKKLATYISVDYHFTITWEILLEGEHLFTEHFNLLIKAFDERKLDHEDIEIKFSSSEWTAILSERLTLLYIYKMSNTKVIVMNAK